MNRLKFRLKFARFLCLCPLLTFLNFGPLQAATVLTPVPWKQLPGWHQDNQLLALQAFQHSCQKMLTLPPQQRLGTDPRLGTFQDWRPVCRQAVTMPLDNSALAREYFETFFTSYAVADGDNPTGLFTGYFVPIYAGSFTRQGAYTVPLYGRPPENLLSLSRAEIDQGALKDKRLEVLWLKSKVDRFFLQIQGSGKIMLPDGNVIEVGFAGKNNHPYTAIGRELIREGALARETVSMQSIRQWLIEHPLQAEAMMNRNASFVFFRRLDSNGIIGAQGVILTPGRSLAIDKTVLAYGLPLWLDTQIPQDVGEAKTAHKRLQRLMVAQDTGSAIQGVVRGDVYWGSGHRAERLAGHMNSHGRYWVLLPKSLRMNSGTASAAK